MTARRCSSALGLTLLSLVVFAGCGDDDDSSNKPAVCASGSGPVQGAADEHCANTTQEIGECRTGDEGAGGAGAEEEEHPTLYNNSGFDDDCKYSVSFENSCVALDQPVTFTVTLKRKADGQPATGATPDSPEIFLERDPSHISPSNNIKAPEGPDGVYEIGPIVFDESGRWVVRFHFFESCSDLPEDSPHGHVAFYIDVP